MTKRLYRSLNWLATLMLLVPCLARAQSPNASPTNLTWQAGNNNLTLSWPPDYIGCVLEVQTNSPDQGLSGTWTTIPGTEVTNVFTVPLDPSNPTVFFRLLRPGELQLQNGDSLTVPHVAARTDGTTFLTWYELTATGYRLRLQRLDATGQALLGVDGVAATAVDQDMWVMDYDLTTDSNDNAILAWPNTTDFTVHVQQFNAQGVAAWGPSGVLLSSANVSAFAPHCVRYTNGDCAIAWLEQTSTTPLTSRVSVVRLNSNGQPAWGTPFSVQIPPRSQGTPQLLQGAADSVILIWVENTAFNAPGDAYAQQIDTIGNAVWPGKVKLNGAARLPFRMSPAVVADNNGGLFATWTTDLGINQFAGLLQHIDQTGALLWATNGVPLSTNSTTLQLPQAITWCPTQQRVVVAWKVTDSTQGVSGINAQAFGLLADPLYPDAGLMIVNTSPDVTGIVGALRSSANGATLFYSQDHGYGQNTEHVALVPAQSGAQLLTTTLSIIRSDKLHPSVSNLVNNGYWVTWDDDRGGIWGAFWAPR